MKANGARRSPILAPGLDITTRDLQASSSLRREPEHEVGGEALAVSFDRLVENARLHAVERGEVGIEQDLVAAYDVLR